MRAELLTCALLLVSTGISAAASNPPYVDHLAALDRVRAAMKSLSFDATIETPKPNGKFSRIAMKFEFSAPDRFRSEIKMGIEGNILTIADGSSIWSIQTPGGKIRRQDQTVARARLRSHGPIDPILALASPSTPLASLFTCVASTDSGATFLLELKPIKSVPNFDRILLEMSRDLATPRFAETFQKGRSVARIRFSSFLRNKTVPENRFIFHPPANSEIMEVR